MGNKLLHYRSSEIKVSKKLQEYFKKIDVIISETINIMRIGEDIVITNGQVEKHTDNTVNGKETIMFVINSEGGYVFEHEDRNVKIKTGDIIRFDGNKLHGLKTDEKNKCSFCAIIWDIKKEVGIDDLIWEFDNRIKELKKEFVNN